MIAWIVCALVACAAAGWALWLQSREKRRLERMDGMLDAALCGEFRPEKFDESLQSSVESKLRDCLAASALSAERLREERKRIEELVSDIAHQTRTPVANLLLYAQLLGERDLDSQARNCTEAMEKQAEKLRALMDALVKVSRMEAGVLALRPELNPVGPMLTAAVAQFRPAAEAKGIELTLVPMEFSARFDPKWTGEALCNLLDNAVKYAPAGGHVRVCAQAGELFCRVDVADDGPGVPEEERAKLFARFYRGKTHARDEGVGLGLYLAREIVTGQGGYMRLRCPDGGGSVFSIYLPGVEGSRGSEAPSAARLPRTQRR